MHQGCSSTRTTNRSCPTSDQQFSHSVKSTQLDLMRLRHKIWHVHNVLFPKFALWLVYQKCLVELVLTGLEVWGKSSTTGTRSNSGTSRSCPLELFVLFVCVTSTQPEWNSAQEGSGSSSRLTPQRPASPPASGPRACLPQTASG